MDEEELSSKMRRDRIIVEAKTKESNELKKKKSKEWPKVAIIILNWNGWKDTIECLESVFRNTYPNYQVIVVDNGSTDGSIEKIKAWAEGKQEVLTPEPTHPLYHLSHPPVKKPIPYIYYTREEAERGGDIALEERVTKEWREQRKSNSIQLNPTSSYPLIFIQTGENLGFAGGNNVGIRYILFKNTIRYLLLLNNDMVVDKGFLRPLVRITKNNKNIGIVGPKVYYYEKIKKIYCAGCDIKMHFLKGLIVSERGKKEIDQGQYDRIEEVGYISGCCLEIKREVIKAIGLMDERYFLYFEETDWTLRIRQLGWKPIYVPQSKVWHKGSHTVGNNNPFRVYYAIRNKLLITQKIFGKKFWFFFYPLFLGKSLILIIQWLFINKNDNGKLIKIQALVNGHLDFLRKKYGIYKE